jgi:hypothetical protein
MLISPQRCAVLIGSALLAGLSVWTATVAAAAQRPVTATAAPALLAGLAPTAAAPAAHHDARHRDSLLGLWTGQVRTTIPTGGTVEYRFNGDGTMEVIVGSVGYPGMWTQQADGSFSFEITLPETDSSGNLTGFNYASQNGQFTSPGSFTSAGTTRIFNLQGTVTKSFGVDITATRLHHRRAA